MTFYKAQYGEDIWLEEHWDELGLPKLGDAGTYCEFGAGDGQYISNTYFLEHGPRGWTGLLCEPHPDQRALPFNRPKSVVERCCVGPHDLISLGLCVDPLLSGELRTGGRSRDNRLQVEKRVQVQQIPLTSLLTRHGFHELHLLSVDTEGTELYALESLDWNRWRPSVCIVELSTWGLPDILLNGGGRDKILEFMGAHDYELVHETQCNGIFKSC